MADKKTLLRILVMALVFGMTVLDVEASGSREKNDDVHKAEFSKINGKLVDLDKKAVNSAEELVKIDGKLDDLDGKVDEILDKLPPQPRLPPRPDPNDRFVPVSMEIIERIKAEGIDLDKLDYFLSANITLHINDTNDKLEIQDGKLIETKSHQSKIIPITTTDAGEKVFGGREFFDISFTEENITLRFEKNMQRNRFDLVSASKGNKNYTLSFGKEKPYLVINYRYAPNDESIQVQGIAASVFLRNDTSPPVDIRISTEKIEGRGTLTPAVIVQFIWDLNRSYSRSFLEEFIGTYFREAGKLEINPDIAIAQMCYETNFLRNQKVMYTRNYAGFTTMPAGGRFRNREEGIQAHIQHLKGYANEKYRPDHIVDPRWNYISNFRGTVDSLDGLAMRWSPNNRYYAAEIANIINNMRRYAQGRV